MKKFKPFTILTIPKMEKWLQKMSVQGYRLVRFKAFTFTFIECAPREREFFIYRSPFAQKNDAFLGEFIRAKMRYQLRKSLLDKKTNEIFEVDPKKKDADYSSYFFSRKRHYLRYHKKMMAVKAIYIVIPLFLPLFSNLTILQILPFVLIAGVSMIYSLISIFCLKYSNLSK